MIKRVFSIKCSQVLLFFILFFSGSKYRKSLNSDELEKDVYFFNCLRGDEDAEWNPAAVVRTVNTTQPRGRFVWADSEVHSKSLLKEFLETSGKHLISPAWWKWLYHRVKMP